MLAANSLCDKPLFSLARGIVTFGREDVNIFLNINLVYSINNISHSTINFKSVTLTSSSINSGQKIICV